MRGSDSFDANDYRDATPSSGRPAWAKDAFPDGPAPDYQVVSVTLPTELLDIVRRRVGANGLSAYITQALMRQEPLAALAEFHRVAAVAFGLAPAELDYQRVPGLVGRPPLR